MEHFSINEKMDRNLFKSTKAENPESGYSFCVSNTFYGGKWHFLKMSKLCLSEFNGDASATQLCYEAKRKENCAEILMSKLDACQVKIDFLRSEQRKQ